MVKPRADIPPVNVPGHAAFNRMSVQYRFCSAENVGRPVGPEAHQRGRRCDIHHALVVSDMIYPDSLRGCFLTRDCRSHCVGVLGDNQAAFRNQVICNALLHAVVAPASRIPHPQHSFRRSGTHAQDKGGIARNDLRAVVGCHKPDLGILRPDSAGVNQGAQLHSGDHTRRIPRLVNLSVECMVVFRQSCRIDGRQGNLAELHIRILPADIDDRLCVRVDENQAASLPDQVPDRFLRFPAVHIALHKHLDAASVCFRK